MESHNQEKANGSVRPSDFRCLIVDNESAHARAMSESLEKVGYKCDVVTAGPDASRQIERENFDIIVTDMVMNELLASGFLSVR
jgi:two-component system response regulator HydG